MQEQLPRSIRLSPSIRIPIRSACSARYWVSTAVVIITIVQTWRTK
jgi:hypothetical protein